MAFGSTIRPSASHGRFRQHLSDRDRSFALIDEISRVWRLKCRHCGNSSFIPFADLGSRAAVERDADRGDSDKPEAYYPLVVEVCDVCFLAQIDEHKAPPKSSISTTPISRPSRVVARPCRGLDGMAVERFRLGPQSQVIEIASNDGYLLQYFQARGIPVLGVEPTANTAEVAIGQGHPDDRRLLRTELPRSSSRAGRSDRRQQRLRPCAGHQRLLGRPEGGAEARRSDLARISAFAAADRTGQFDTIYHEHFSYLSLARRAHPRCSRASSSSMSSNCRPMAGRFGCLPPMPTTRPSPARRASTQSLRTKISAGLRGREVYESFQPRIERIRDDFLQLPARSARRRARKLSRLWRGGQGQYPAQLLRDQGQRPDPLRRRIQPAQAGPLPARQPHSSRRTRTGSTKKSPISSSSSHGTCATKSSGSSVTRGPGARGSLPPFPSFRSCEPIPRHRRKRFYRQRDRPAAVADGHEVVAHRGELDLLDASGPDRGLSSDAGATHCIHAAWYTNHADYLTQRDQSRMVRGQSAARRRLLQPAASVSSDLAPASNMMWPMLTDHVPKTARRSARKPLCPLQARAVRGASAERRSFAWARIFFVYGPGDRAGRLIPEHDRTFARGEAAGPTYGGLRRDYIHVDDLAGQLVRIALSDVQGASIPALARHRACPRSSPPAPTAFGRPELALANEETGGQPPLIQADLAALPARYRRPEAQGTSQPASRIWSGEARRRPDRLCRIQPRLRRARRPPPLCRLCPAERHSVRLCRARSPLRPRLRHLQQRSARVDRAQAPRRRPAQTRVRAGRCLFQPRPALLAASSRVPARRLLGTDSRLFAGLAPDPDRGLRSRGRRDLLDRRAARDHPPLTTRTSSLSFDYFGDELGPPKQDYGRSGSSGSCGKASRRPCPTCRSSVSRSMICATRSSCTSSPIR